MNMPKNILNWFGSRDGATRTRHEDDRASSYRWNIMLISIGLLIAGILVGGGQWLIMQNARSTSERTLNNIAGRMLQHAETALDEALTALTEIALHGVSKCNDFSVDLMRRTVYSTFSVKQIGLLTADRGTRCNHLGSDDSPIRPISDLFESRNRSVHIRAVEFAASNMIGTTLVWQQGDGSQLTAIVSGRALAVDILPDAWRTSGIAIIRLDDGTMLGYSNRVLDSTNSIPTGRSSIRAAAESERYPIAVEVLVPFEAVWLDYEDLYAYAQIGGFILAIFVIGLTIFATRNDRGHINEIEIGIKRNEFIPYYQPIVDIRTGKLYGCEVLIRWRKNDGSIVTPGVFIGLAEATGLAVPMTQQLMMRVRDDLGQAFFERPHLRASFNLFGDHFESLDIIDDIERIFDKSRIRYRQLIFEVTERQPLLDMETAKQVIRSLQALGCRVALDDAGTGHSGLASLQELGMDVLKIDKLFVDAIGTNRFAAPIIRSLVGLARNCNMTVVAEGVETFEQVEYLKALGISAAQGYVFAPPLPTKLFLELVEKMEPLRYQSLVDTDDIDFVDEVELRA